MKGALLRAVIVVVAAAVLVAATSAAPAALRRMDAFRVERVEVTGVRHLEPAAAVHASGITPSSSVFDDPSPWIESLRRHPLVASAAVERRVPSTIVLRLRESEPVALARTPELVPVDEHGRMLPASPSADGMDVPVLVPVTRVAADGTATDDETLAAVRFLGTVRRLEPGLLGWISEVATHGDAIRLVLRNATDAEVLVPAVPTAERLRELHLTLAELATPRLAAASDPTRARDAGAELSRVKRIDGRFHDQIVVALQRGKN